MSVSPTVGPILIPLICPNGQLLLGGYLPTRKKAQPRTKDLSLGTDKLRLHGLTRSDPSKKGLQKLTGREGGASRITLHLL